MTKTKRLRPPQPKRGKVGRPANKLKVVEQLMTLDELSDYLKLSKSHIYTLTSKKKIPHIKLLGKKILFDKEAINRWLKTKYVDAQ